MDSGQKRAEKHGVSARVKDTKVCCRECIELCRHVGKAVSGSWWFCKKRNVFIYI